MGATILLILIVLVCILLCLIVLVQNPKGGGLSATFGGVSSGLLGHKRTTEKLEQFTWGFAIALIALSLASKFFISGEVVGQQGGTIVDGTTNPFLQGGGGEAPAPADAYPFEN